MSEHEIIREEGDLRVSLSRDEYPDEPYDYGQAPIIRIDRRWGSTAEHIMIGDRPTDHDARIEEAAERWSGDSDSLEKYLRAFHGTTVVKWYGPNNYTDYTYAVYDTEEWREAAGAPEKAANMNEWIAYLEGEVYTYDIERRVNIHESKTRTRNNDAPVTTERDFDEWEHVDSCGGFYGYDYARQEALEAFDWQTKAAKKED